MQIKSRIHSVIVVANVVLAALVLAGIHSALADDNDSGGALLNDLLESIGLDQLHQPPEGFVPDSATAVGIAEAVWLPVYGDDIDDMRPFRAALWQDSLWVVKGTLPDGMLGGVPYAVIRKSDASVLGVIHTK